MLFIWVLAACAVPNVWLSLVEPLSVFGAVTNLMLPLGVYMLLMSSSPKIGRTSLWMIIVMFFAAFQMVLLYMYGRSVIAVDMFLNLVTTNPGEVGELLGNLLPIIAAVILVYGVPIVIAVVAVVKGWRLSAEWLKTSRRAGWVVTGCGAFCLTVSIVAPEPYSLKTDLYPLNVFYNVGVAVDRTMRMASYPETSAGYTFEARSLRPDTLPEVYVAVIGETSRALDWQLYGYGRKTTPRLMGRNGLVAFPKAISQSNTTHKSVPMLMSALDASNFGDSIYHVKSFISAFKEAGFRTAFFSNQNRNHSFIDRFGEEADTCLFIRELSAAGSGPNHDSELLQYLESELKSGHRKLLVILHTYGSHFSYMDRYPEADAVFTPALPPDASKAFRDQLVNAYDNTIVGTSNLLADIIDILQASGRHAALIYTSDHGEDIFDDERNLFLHASPCPSYYQIHVPFLMWMSPQFIEANPTMASAAVTNSGRFVCSSQAYFHTLMQLAGLESVRWSRGASLADSSYSEPRAVYLNDHNKLVTLRKSGLLEPDFQRLDSLGVAY